MTAFHTERARQIGKVGGLTTVVRLGPDFIASRARAGLWRKFEDAVDPERRLPAAELHRRATLEMRRHYAGMAVKSAAARKKAPTT